ncbi:MAG: NAD-dependent epimerase/dehydratase family protein [Streptosporangiales bacterium]
MARVILVTGVARSPGECLAASLAGGAGIDRVIGIDIVPPRGSIAPADFVRADTRGASLRRLLEAYEVDTVVHAGIVAGRDEAGGRGGQKDINVIGTMQLLAACQRAKRITKLVVRSSIAVYGLSPRNPALFTEDDPPRRPPASGFGKDMVEVEGYARGFARRRPDVPVTVLRMAYLLDRDSLLARYLSLPAVPTVLGYDPRVQVLDADDAAEALRRAAVEEHPGTYNIAGAGVVTVAQAAHLAGRPTVPIPSRAIGAVSRVMRQAHVVDAGPELAGTVMHSQVVDTAKARTEFGWTPRLSTRDALSRFVQERGLRPTMPTWVRSGP